MEVIFSIMLSVIILITTFALGIAAGDIILRFWVNKVCPWLDDKIGPL